MVNEIRIALSESATMVAQRSGDIQVTVANPAEQERLQFPEALLHALYAWQACANEEEAEVMATNILANFSLPG